MSVKQFIIDYINYIILTNLEAGNVMSIREHRDEILYRSLGYVDFAYNSKLIDENTRYYFIDKLCAFTWYY